MVSYICYLKMSKASLRNVILLLVNSRMTRHILISARCTIESYPIGGSTTCMGAREPEVLDAGTNCI